MYQQEKQKRHLFSVKLSKLLFGGALLLAASTAAYADVNDRANNSHANSSSVVVQERGVVGTVVDQAGHPIAGASVKVKDATSYTITDNDGKFTLADIPEGAVLIISYVGMRQRNKVGTQKQLHSIGRERCTNGRGRSRLCSQKKANLPFGIFHQ